MFMGQKTCYYSYGENPKKWSTDKFYLCLIIDKVPRRFSGERTVSSTSKTEERIATCEWFDFGHLVHTRQKGIRIRSTATRHSEENASLSLSEW
jgi:hypothetical protein